MMTSFGSSENWGSVTKICRMESAWSESTRTAAPTMPRLVCVLRQNGDDRKPERFGHPAEVRGCPHIEKDLAEHRAFEDAPGSGIHNPPVRTDRLCNRCCRHLDTVATDPPVFGHPEPVLEQEPHHAALGWGVGKFVDNIRPHTLALGKTHINIHLCFRYVISVYRIIVRHARAKSSGDENG